MALPKLEHPTFEFEVPSLDKTFRFRPFLVKEEKILLFAQQTKSRKDIVRAIKQVVNNCCVDSDFDVDILHPVDIEYLFIKLRSVSVNNMIEVTYIDNEDGEEYKFKIDAEQIEIKKPKKKVSNKIMINEKVGIRLKQPTAVILDKMPEDIDDFDVVKFFIKACLEDVFDDKEVIDFRTDTSDEELDAWIDEFPTEVVDKIKKFLDNTAKMEYVINYKNKKDHDRKIVLSTLEDFFTFL